MMKRITLKIRYCQSSRKSNLSRFNFLRFDLGSARTHTPTFVQIGGSEKAALNTYRVVPLRDEGATTVAVRRGVRRGVSSECHMSTIFMTSAFRSVDNSLNLESR